MDQLFKNKLGEHRLPPSAEAWSKVEAGLVKKNNVVILWRAAAVFVLFGLLTGAWHYWQSGQQGQPQQLVTKPSATDNKPEVQEPIPAQQESEESKTQVAVIKKRNGFKNEKSKITEDTQEQIPELVPTENLVIVETELIADAIKITSVPLTKIEKPIVIEFTLDPVPARTTFAQAEDGRSNGLEKILDKARDIKNGDSELGSLRDAKNELFALDFRKDKPKRN